MNELSCLRSSQHKNVNGCLWKEHFFLYSTILNWRKECVSQRFDTFTHEQEPSVFKPLFGAQTTITRLQTTSILYAVEKWGGFYRGLLEILGVASHKFQELNSCSVTSDCGDVGRKRFYSWLNVTEGNDLNPMSFQLWTKILYLILFHFFLSPLKTSFLSS